jgi:hypothetical protein
MGQGCAQNEIEAIALFKQAAELGLAEAQWQFGTYVFDVLSWESHHWRGLAVARGTAVQQFCSDIIVLLPLLEKGGMGRVLHIAVTAISAAMDVAQLADAGQQFDSKKLRRAVQLHDAMLSRARRAVACWSVVALRLKVVKDVRVMIAKMACDELWMWDKHNAIKCCI